MSSQRRRRSCEESNQKFLVPSRLKKTTTSDTHYPIDVDEYECEVDGLPPLLHKGAVVIKKKSNPGARKKKLRREAEDLPAAPAATQAPLVSPGPMPKHIVWVQTRDWTLKWELFDPAFLRSYPDGNGKPLVEVVKVVSLRLQEGGA